MKSPYQFLITRNINIFIIVAGIARIVRRAYTDRPHIRRRLIFVEINRFIFEKLIKRIMLGSYFNTKI